MEIDVWDSDVLKEHARKIILIRHGATRGNIEKRYIGQTQESLSNEGIEELKKNINLYRVSENAIIFTSPMTRCIETARLIYPNYNISIVEGLQETNFGIFEGKSYQELKDLQAYRDWLSSNGEKAPLGTESRTEVRKRVCEAFEREVRGAWSKTKEFAFVVHGGTIMHILSKFTKNSNMYDYQIGNGDGYRINATLTDGLSLKTEDILRRQEKCH